METQQPFSLPGSVELVSAVEGAFPELAGSISPMSILGEGYEFAAFESSSGIVFRFPKREEAARKQKVENALLPELSAALPAAIPVPRLQAGPSPMCPWGFHGYQRLPGIPVADLRDTAPLLPALAPQVAGFLAALHSFPVDRALALGVPAAGSWLQSFGEMHRFLMAELKSRLTPVKLGNVDEWWRSFLRITDGWCFSPVLTHGDLGPEHVLVQPQTHALSGVIDFGDVVVGDPALDFAGMIVLGDEEFMLEVARVYRELGGPADSEVTDRARLLSKTVVFHEVVAAITLGHSGPPVPTIEQALRRAPRQGCLHLTYNSPPLR